MQDGGELAEAGLKEAAGTGARRRVDINPPVFYVSAGLTLAFALCGALAPELAGRTLRRPKR